MQERPFTFINILDIQFKNLVCLFFTEGRKYFKGLRCLRPMNASTSLYLTNQHSSYSMLAMFKSHIILTLFFFHLTDIMSFPFQVVQQREIMFVYIKASPTTSIG